MSRRRSIRDEDMEMGKGKMTVQEAGKRGGAKVAQESVNSSKKANNTKKNKCVVIIAAHISLFNFFLFS